MSNALRKIPDTTLSLSDRNPSDPALSDDAQLTGQASGISFVMLVLLPAVTVLFFCLFRLNDRSLGSGDESLYALATQGTAQSSHWWLPMWNGKPYFMTAPLKLWLNLIAIAVFGESNFSYRVMDALSGCGTFLVMYLFALDMTRDRRVGAIAVAALLGSTSYMFLHGPRQGVLDSVLLFFTVVATYSGWKIVQRVETTPIRPDGCAIDRVHAMGWAVLGGLSIGLGFMTKSVAILPPLAIVGLYSLLRGTALRVLLRAWREILVCVTLGILIPLPYYLGHCLFSDHACESLVAVNVVRRVTDGYVNTDLPFFYLRQIFVKRRLIPPELFVFGLVWALASRKQAGAVFLLVWALLPLCVYSMIPSRLPWYIASSYPAFALLCGASLVALYDRLRSSTPLVRILPQKLSFVLSAALFAVGAGGLILHLVWSVQKLTERPTRIAYDRAAEALLRAEKRNPEHGQVILHQAFDVPYRELPYRNMLVGFTTREDDPEKLRDLARDERTGFVITKAEQAPLVVRSRPLHSYMVLPPLAGRSWPIMVGSWRDDMPSKYFRPVDTALFLADRSDAMLYGWGEIGEFPTLRYRWTSGERTGLLLDVDPVRAALGIKLTSHLSVTEPLQMTVWVNQTPVSSVNLHPGDFRYSTFRLPHQELLPGMNPVVFSFKKLSGEPVAESEKLAMFSSLRVELMQD
ncbi:MAG: phospholipid carrier-dependent glycosyltransferase [Bdellovibrionota bacterium]